MQTQHIEPGDVGAPTAVAPVRRGVQRLSRRVRRLLVVATIASAPAGIVLDLATSREAERGPTGFVTTFSPMLLALVSAVIVWWWASGRFDLAALERDPGLQWARDRMNASAYRVLSVLVSVLLFALLSLDWFAGPAVVAVHDVVEWLFLLAVVNAFLPYLVLAWEDADPPPR